MCRSRRAGRRWRIAPDLVSPPTCCPKARPPIRSLPSAPSSKISPSSASANSSSFLSSRFLPLVLLLFTLLACYPSPCSSTCFSSSSPSESCSSCFSSSCPMSFGDPIGEPMDFGDRFRRPHWRRRLHGPWRSSGLRRWAIPWVVAISRVSEGCAGSTRTLAGSPEAGSRTEVLGPTQRPSRHPPLLSF